MTQPSTMRALEMQDLNRLELVERSVPEVGDGEVLVRTLATTICTSDLVDLAENAFGGPMPRILGHEADGVVVEVGQGVTHVTVGQHVAAHPVFPCGACDNCQRNLNHLCLRMGHLGLNWPGTFAEFFRAPAARVVGVPSTMDPAVAALLEPTAVCMQALHRAAVTSGQSVLIVGDGPFGVITSRLAARGEVNAILAGRHHFRLRQGGTDLIVHEPSQTDPLAIVRAMADQEGVDAAILCVASAQALELACAALRTRGRLVVFSAFSQPVPIDLFRVHVKELEIVGACNDEEQLSDVASLLDDDKLALHEIVTHRFRLEQHEAALRLATHSKDEALKVAFVMEEAA